MLKLKADFSYSVHLFSLQHFSKNYLSHFSFGFLFTGDKNARSQIPGFGQIFFPDLIFVLAGLLYVVKIKKSITYLPLVLILIGLIPSAITKEAPHALRAISAVPFIAFLSAMGVFYLGEKMKLGWKLILAVAILYFVLFINYFWHFLIVYPVVAAKDWQDEYKKVFTQYPQQFKNFDFVTVSDWSSQPYIFALFYLKYDSEKFRNEVIYNQTIRKATSAVRSFNKFIFTNVDFYNFPQGSNLIFSNPRDKMDEINEKEKIFYPDGSVAFYVYEYEK